MIIKQSQVRQGVAMGALFLIALQGCRAQQTPAPSAAVAAPPIWTDAERAACLSFWNQPGRTQITFVKARAVLTPAASRWFHAYDRALRHAPPDDVAAWKAWVDAKFARDRWEANAIARADNSGPAPDPPGVIPQSLLAMAGDPPPLSAAETPKKFTIDLAGDGGTPLVYEAPISINSRYGSYRFDQGIISGGEPLRRMPAADLNSLMLSAGLTQFQANVIGAVSRLEGGFDAVNTYDTGYVSVGFIQFTTGALGTGSLGDVLATEKAANPTAFVRDFHERGIDVTPAHIYAVVDPATGAELSGADAVQDTIRDPRLMAAFQAAGRRSQAFRIAQIQTAKTGYYPADDPITVLLPNGTSLSGHVRDVLKSEAGMATAFDRKVNTGGCAAEVSAAVTQIITANNLTTLAEVAPYERNLVEALRYRADFLSDKSLTQPPAPPTAPAAPIAPIAPTTEL